MSDKTTAAIAAEQQAEAPEAPAEALPAVTLDELEQVDLGTVEQGGELGAGDGIPGVQRAGVGAEFRPGHGVLGQALAGHADGLQAPARQVAEHGQAAVFILGGLPAGWTFQTFIQDMARFTI